MKPLLALAAISLALALSPAHAATAHAQDASAAAEHQHEAHAATAASTPEPGKRWATDAPLREGMGRIRTSVDGLSHSAQGHLSAGQAKDLAADIGETYSVYMSKSAPVTDHHQEQRHDRDIV